MQKNFEILEIRNSFNILNFCNFKLIYFKLVLPNKFGLYIIKFKFFKSF